MPRRFRLQYRGAIYRLMACGNITPNGNHRVGFRLLYGLSFPRANQSGRTA
jgi:hypothetical protein